MKSSDQRYFQVRRPKSQTNHYVELAKALRDARQDPLKVIEVDKLVLRAAYKPAFCTINPPT